MNILIVGWARWGHCSCRPAAAALRNAFPDARIDWLVEARHRPMVDLVSVIDRAIVLERRRSPDGWMSRAECARFATTWPSISRA
jgi:ADP-heptose:LPS heptosyltransferase